MNTPGVPTIRNEQSKQRQRRYAAGSVQGKTTHRRLSSNNGLEQSQYNAFNLGSVLRLDYRLILTRINIAFIY